jgi:hypothetical protein
VGEIPHIASAFREYLEKCKLVKFRMSATGLETTLGADLVPFIEVLLHAGTLDVLDISGQSVGENGLELIISNLPGRMDGFMFDGSGISSGEALIGILQSLAVLLKGTGDKRLNRTSWPDRDLKSALAGTPVEERSTILTVIEGIRQDIECFGLVSGGVALSRTYMVVGESAAKQNEVGKRKILAFEGDVKVGGLDENPFRFDDDLLEDILEECELGDRIDPILGMAAKLKEEYEFPRLLEGLRRKDG